MQGNVPRVHPTLPRFERLDLIYKSSNGTDFIAAVLVPKTVISSENKTSSPLLVHFHGGGLIMGTPLDPEILSVWPLELAAAENAVVVSPAYRLLPEATGGEVLDDVKDFWVWVRTALASEIAARWSYIHLDIDRAAVFGESAGGYLSLQSAFLCPGANIKLVMPQYCAMFPDLREYNSGSFPTPPDAADVADAYIKSIKPGAIRLYEPYWSFLPTTLAILSSGRKVAFMSDDVRLNLDYGLSHAKKLPPIWIAQGEDDVIISKSATDEMVEQIRKTHPDVPLHYSVQPGPHGFDNDSTLSDTWVAEGVEFARKYWP